MSVDAGDLIMHGTSLNVGDRGSTLVKKLSGKYHALPVVNDDREVVGIVSEQSILRALRTEKTLFECTAGTLMTCGHLGHESCGNPVAVSPDTPVRDVVRTMLREQLSVVPVVKRRKLVGLLSRKDLVSLKRA